LKKKGKKLDNGKKREATSHNEKNPILPWHQVTRRDGKVDGMVKKFRVHRLGANRRFNFFGLRRKEVGVKINNIFH